MEVNREQKRKRGHNISNRSPKNRIQYVELLLEMSLKDYRKNVISLILAPYFVNIQKLSDADSFDRIKEWVLRSNDVKGLEPSVEYFDELNNKAIKRARETGIKPLRFEETLRYKNQELYDLLHQSKSNMNIL